MCQERSVESTFCRLKPSEVFQQGRIDQAMNCCYNLIRKRTCAEGVILNRGREKLCSNEEWRIPESAQSGVLPSEFSMRISQMF